MPAGAALRSAGRQQAKEALQRGCRTGLCRAGLQAQHPVDKATLPHHRASAARCHPITGDVLADHSPQEANRHPKSWVCLSQEEQPVCKAGATSSISEPQAGSLRHTFLPRALPWHGGPCYHSGLLAPQGPQCCAHRFHPSFGEAERLERSTDHRSALINTTRTTEICEALCQQHDPGWETQACSSTALLHL
ncbi:hypothetical protein DV515_00011639 [Chloebia gouldiae]|uniref:Uncharacterized protein n=1 Tax=Chloebia gouldiae TaxID=44316 RepID=A0A3L8S734_CHLGU|nr:hypothetical protein DV515_00011639 [Chloebia gouldiae]